MRHGALSCVFFLVPLLGVACDEEASLAMPDWDTVACFGVTPPDSAWSAAAGPVTPGEDARAADTRRDAEDGDAEATDGEEVGPTDVIDASLSDAGVQDAEVDDALETEADDALETEADDALETEADDASGADAADVSPSGDTDDSDGRDTSGEAPAEPAGDTCLTAPGSCVGVPPPGFDLRDFQPQSCGYEAVYGLDVYVGRITVVGLMAAWCGFCLAQVQYMEQMRYEMQTAGYDVEFIAINAWNAVAQQEKLHERCAFPLLQDQEDIDVWGLLDGSKDDFYIYDRDGNLAVHLPRFGDAWPGSLALPEGYETLRSAILSVE